jgi:NADH-quinone oxidoreductase subunit L
MSDPKDLIILIPALPLAATLITALFGKRVLKQRSHLPALLACMLAFVFSLLLIDSISQEAHHARVSGQAHGSVGQETIVSLWTWASVLDVESGPNSAATRPFHIDVALRADALTAMMLGMVTFISSLIVLYSSGYMHGDEGYWRFFTYISLFVFSMTMLVSVSNFALLYVFWEAVGVCSYLLIGFWFQKPEAAAAGKKAFLVNRVGDFGFALGIFLIWTTYGTLDFHDNRITQTVTEAGAVQSETIVKSGVFGQSRLQRSDGYEHGPIALAICLLLMLGACGKSAQFPLHVWLPDAMEGPTPVSALIHAATMVTAGVYMVARCTPLFMASPEAQVTVAVIGCFTALLAGLIALTQNDLKRVLAYSTISQLGYMFLGLGVGTLGGIIAGMFHLFTHAFFKALLFLGAGSVMHAMGGVIDVRRFGGLKRLMPRTHWTFLCGAAALAGFPLLSGFWSKDAILAAVQHGPDASYGYGPIYQGLFIAGLFTALLTAFYTFRVYFLTFHGKERVPPEAGRHAHESPPVMTVPLIILAVCSLGVGIIYELTGKFTGFLVNTPSLAYAAKGAHAADATHAADSSHLMVAALSTLAALAGIGLAWLLYRGSPQRVETLATALRPAYQASHQKFWFDQIYQVTIVWPLQLLATISYVLDRLVIDGLVDLVGRLPALAGNRLRALQIGLVSFYALAMVLGLLVMLGMLLRWPAV